MWGHDHPIHVDEHQENPTDLVGQLNHGSESVKSSADSRLDLVATQSNISRTEQLCLCSSRSSIESDMGLPPHRNEDRVSILNQQGTSIVNGLLKSMPEDGDMETVFDLRPQKLQKNAVLGGIADEVDRISCLEDTLLCHILSFLPTIYAVRTSVLSRRWKHSWTKTPILDFSEWSDAQGEKDKFASCVSKVLLLNNTSCLKKLCFDYLLQFDLTHVDTWLANLLKREIKEVNLCNGFCHNSIDWPAMAFAQVRPVVLKLSGGSIRKLPASIKYSNLKILHLTDLESLNANLNKLVAGCPILEELDIYNCRWYSVEIESSTLKRLAVRYCYPSNPINNSHDLIVKTPNLEELSLSYFKALSGWWNFVQMKCLMKGRICLCSMSLPLLLLVSGTKTLYLNSARFSKRVIKSLGDNRLCFTKLTYLELEVAEDALLIVPTILHCSPNLVSFVFIKGMSDLNRSSTSTCPEGKWINPSVNLECLSSCLNFVTISFFEQCEDYLDMVRYFLRTAKVLKELRLTMFKLDADKEISILRRLLFLPRASVTCQVKALTIL